MRILNLLLLCLLPTCILGQQISLDDQLVNTIYSNDIVKVKALVSSGADVNYMPADSMTPLARAIKSDNAEIFSYLVSKGADVNHGGDFTLPLHSAAFWSQEKIVHMILEHGGDVNIENSYGETALHSISEAISMDKSTIPVVRYLIEHGANIHAKKENSYTPLLLACKDKRRTEIAKYLVANGANVNDQVENYSDYEKYHGFSPLHIALLTKNYELAEYLVRHGAEVNRPVPAMVPNSWVDNYGGFAPLHFVALDTAALHLVDLLIDKGASPEQKLYQYWTPLRLACSERNKNLALTLLKYDSFHLNHPKLSMEELYTQTLEKIRLDSMLYAAAEDSAQVMDYLSSGADLNYCEFGFRLGSVFSKALESGNTGLSSRLLDQGSDVQLTDREGMTALHYACSNEKNLALVERIIDMGAKLEVMSYERPAYKDEKPYYTPLLYAVVNNQIDIVKLLLARGAVKNTFSRGSEPTFLESRPLLYALFNEKTEMADFLIESGFDLDQSTSENMSNYYGFTALHYAVNQEDSALVAKLIEKGADLNLKIEGYTALHITARRAYHAIADILISAGAELNVKASERIHEPTALHLCIEYDNYALLQKLLEAGADINLQDADGNTPLNYSLMLEKYDFAHALLKRKPNIIFVNNEGYSPLHYASFYEPRDSLAISLIEMGADVNGRINKSDNQYPGFTAMHFAALNDDVELIYTLLSYGADKSIVNSQGQNPLEIAQSSASLNAINLLRDPDFIVFYYLEFEKIEELIKALNSKPELLEKQDRFDRSLLHRLVLDGRMDILSRLQSFPGEIDYLDADGRTPFFISIFQKRNAIAELLLKKGADPNIEDKYGYTCYYYADSEMKEILEAYDPQKSWNIIPELEVFDPNSERIFSLLMCDNDRKALSCGSSGKIKLWDLISGKQLRSMDFSAKKLLLNESEDLVLAIGERIQIWDIKTGFLLHEYDINVSSCSQVDFHPSGKAFVFAEKGVITQVDIINANIERLISMNEEEIHCLRYNNSGNGIAFGTNKSSMAYADLKSGETSYYYSKEGTEIKLIDISPDSKYLVTVSELPGTKLEDHYGRAPELSDSLLVNIWNIKNGTLEYEVIPDLKTIQVIEWITDKRILLAGNQWDAPFIYEEGAYRDIVDYEKYEESRLATNTNRLRILTLDKIQRKKYTLTPLHSFTEGANYIPGEKDEYEYDPIPNRADDKNASIYHQISAFALNKDGSSALFAKVDYDYYTTTIMDMGGLGTVSMNYSLKNHNIFTYNFISDKGSNTVTSGLGISGTMSASGKKILFNYGDSLLYYKNTITGNTIAEYKIHSHTSKNKSLDFLIVPGEKNFYSNNYYGHCELYKWNTGFNLPIRKICSGFNRETFEITPDARKILSTENLSVKGSLSVFDTEKDSVIHRCTIDVFGRISTLKSHPDGNSFAIGSSEGVLILKDLSNYKTLHEYEGNTSDVLTIDFSKDGEYIIAGGYDKIVRLWNTHSGELLQQFYGHKGSISDVRFSKDGKYILSGSEDETVNYWDVQKGELIASLKGHNTSVGSIRFLSADRAISESEGGLLIIWDLNSYKEIVRIIPSRSGEWAMITPDLYYFASKSVLKDISFHVGENYFNFEQFDLRYNRPDIILERIGLADQFLIQLYKKASEKRIRKHNIDNEELVVDWHAPRIEIVGKESISNKSSKKNLKVKVRASDSKYDLSNLNVWINDVPVYGSKGYSLLKKSVSKIQKNINLMLSQGRNKIEVSVTNNQGTESMKDYFYLDYQPEDERKPDLYIASICCADFNQSQYNLEYSIKDGRDIVGQFANSDAFSNVFVDTLFNEEVNKGNIKRLKEKLLTSKVDDNVIVHIAGHGLLDVNLSFIFPTPETDFANPEVNGIPYDLLEGLLDSIPARKNILFMDACHSGETDKESMLVQEGPQNAPQSGVSRAGLLSTYNTEKNSKIGLGNSFTLMNELFTDLNLGSGAIVISAASGDSFAFESDEWQNGVFTYSILQGIKSMKADLDLDGIITVQELHSYVIDQVQELTNGEQKPTCRQENINLDYRIW